MLLAACEPEPKGPVQVVQPEAMRFDTERIRREVDNYRSLQSAASKRKMEQAFQALDAKIQSMEALAQSQNGLERMSTEEQIADLKHRREMHWQRAQTPIAEQTVKRAEQVGERVSKAEPTNGKNRAKRTTGQARLQYTQQPSRTPNPIGFLQRMFSR